MLATRKQVESLRHVIFEEYARLVGVDKRTLTDDTPVRDDLLDALSLRVTMRVRSSVMVNIPMTLGGVVTSNHWAAMSL